MLIYDHTKKLVGIDEEDLRLLGFGSFDELLTKCTDIADLFVKKPGYIHNFKNFQWIDFVLHSESEHSKAIIDNGNKSFACDLSIKPFYLISAPQQTAYAIHLQHIKPLTSAETADLSSGSVPEPKKPEPAPAITPEYKPEPPVAAAAPIVPQNDLPSFDDIAPTILNEPETAAGGDEHYLDDPYDLPENIYPDFNKPLEIEDDIFVDATPEEPVGIVEAPAPASEPEPLNKAAEQPMLGDYLTPDQQAYADQMKNFNNYVYDPHVAADELGLPVDLIEEFIGDFIGQAHDFHDDLMDAAAKSDFETVKLLSHKLKGVAANLRIEDSFEMLAVINNSHDAAEIDAYLKMFYRTIAKLEGKEVLTFTPAPEAPAALSEPEPFDIPAAPVEIPEEPVLPEASIEDDDIYAFDIKTTAADAGSPQTAPADDDLYSFDIAPEPILPNDESFASTAVTETDNLYAFETTFHEPGVPLNSDEIDHIVMDEPAPQPEEAFEPDLPAIADMDVFETVNPPVAVQMHYDATAAANELGLPKDIVDELIRDFSGHTRDIRDNLDNVIASGDAEQWRSYASEMKGIADNLRMKEIATALQDLETAADAAAAKTAKNALYALVEQL